MRSAIPVDDRSHHVIKSILFVVLAALWVTLSSCRERTATEVIAGEREGKEEKVSPQERKFIEGGRPFVNAIAARQYEAAYGLLSSHARARMSVNQFVAATDDNQYKRNEANALTNVKLPEFTNWMAKVEAEHGLPAAVKTIYVFSMDPAALSGRGEALDSLFAIGAMPKSVPFDIRRASLRCQVATRLTPVQLQAEAKRVGMTLEELQKNPDFEPYFNLKAVLVEEEGALKVGYFEFLPPSVLD
jgi:hypothetical protein